MIPLVILAITFIALLSIIYVKRKNRLRKEFLERVQDFKEKISQFYAESANLLTHFVDKQAEDEFTLKWQGLFLDLFKYCHLKELRDHDEIRNFLTDYGEIHNHISVSNKEVKRREKVQKFLPQITEFFKDLFELEKHYITHLDTVRFTQKWTDTANEIEKVDVRPSDLEYEIYTRFKAICNSFHDYFQIANATYMHEESKRCEEFLSDIDGKSLDQQQRTAVIDDEDRILVLAGAGSGKTLTIAAKVKYLCEKKGVDPKDILLISFTKKSAQEMTDRIQKKLGIQIEAETFHKLGLEIIKSADGFRPDISDESELNTLVHDFFEKEFDNSSDFIRNLTEYFAYYLEVPENVENYSSLGELFQAEKSADLETIKTKYERAKYIKDVGSDKAKNLTTLNNEKVKSLEETKIANFLFLNGINYEYEKLYPYETGDPLRKRYRPDFYLTDYDIYLEHFGINKDFSAPWLSYVEEQKYLEGIRWKRDLHSANKTKLIETYSYYNSEGILFEKLKEILTKNHVEFKPRNFTDVFNTVYKSKSNKYLPEFIKLCCTFITLFKSNNYKVEDIDQLRQKEIKSSHNKFLCERINLFLDIIKVILAGYQEYLASKNAIDFSDMINNAADRISSGCTIPNYRYIIVDEYQDISKSRFNLVKSLVDRTGAKIFCVGDDWQSIYRFAGSDISLFTEFENYLGFTHTLKIEKTYRNSQQLIDEASRFVLKNPLQLRKELRSDKSLEYPLVFWGYEKDPSLALNGAIKKIVSEFGTSSSILFLGRTNYDKEILKEFGLFKISTKNKKETLQYIPIPELKVSFLTVHKSKGLEADNVIVLNFKNDNLGFPNQIENDDVLNLVLTREEDYRFAEERRLFYVAITRTRNRTFVLTDSDKPSLFFDEFPESTSVCYTSISKKFESKQHCPRCKTGILSKINHDGSVFIGCSNYPRCRYTLSNPDFVINHRCPFCGGFMKKIKGNNGHWFIGCTNFPHCHYTEEYKRSARIY